MIKGLIAKLVYRIYVKGRFLDQEKEYEEIRKKYKLHDDFRFNGEHIQFYGDGEIIVGAGCYIGEFSTIQALPNCKVIIGKGCSISHNVRMYTQSAVADQDFSKLPLKVKTGDIIIGDYVWIGANVFINPGVTVGDNSVVGANSVVVKDVEPFSIIGGVPAKFIRYKEIPGESE